MLQQIQIKYMTALRQGTELRPEDLGAVRLALRMAMEELHLQYRHDLADMDDIIADLIEQRDQLKATVAMDAAEILRLQTMEDCLIAWVHEHEPQMADQLIATDTAAVIIDLLSKGGGATVAPPPAPVAVNGNGHLAVRERRPDGIRVNVDLDDLREQALTTLRSLTAQLGHTPTQREFEQLTGVDIPSIQTIKKKLHCTYNDLVDAAGLERNKSIVETRKEAKAENAEAPFRGQ